MVFDILYIILNHKNRKDPNLRPIILQIPSPIYKTNQEINAIISQYFLYAFKINSTDEFLSIVKSTTPNGLMASLDVENLFMNIPLTKTIEII